MATYFGLSGKTLQTADKPFAGGGEGDIFDIVGSFEEVAKIYKADKRTTERERKLFTMVRLKPKKHIEQYSWPLDVLYENESFAGYTMPKVTDKEKLRNIYVYGNREGPWTLYIHIAKNLAAAVHAVHEIGQTIGDLNPENILVHSETGRVTLVDTDSFHITDPSGNVYRCNVGTSAFVAPELQGKHFASAPLPTFTKETDLFSLSVLIFALLMNGAHPFACRAISGSSSKFQQDDNIVDGVCAYFEESRVPNIDIPRYAPTLESLPQNLQNLFKRAFVAGHGNPKKRPAAKEYYNVLEMLENDIKVCDVNSDHIYFCRAKECPWCEVDRKMKKIEQSDFVPHAMSGASVSQTQIPNPPSGQSPGPTFRPGASNAAPVKKKKSKALNVALDLVIVAMIIYFIVRTAMGGGGEEAKTPSYSERPAAPAQTSPVDDDSREQSTDDSDRSAVIDHDSQEQPPDMPEPKRKLLSEMDFSSTWINVGEFIVYDEVKDNYGTTYDNGLGGSSDDISEQKYDVSDYKYIEGRVVLDFDARTLNYGDRCLLMFDDNGDLIYMSPNIGAGIEPVDFKIDISEVNTLQMIIRGQDTLRLVDCVLSTAESEEKYSTATESTQNETSSDYVYLNELEWYNASVIIRGFDLPNENGFKYYGDVKDNFGVTYSNGIGGNDSDDETFQSYKIDGRFSRMTGTVVLNQDVETLPNEDIYLWIYGDERLLYQSPPAKLGMAPESLDISLDGIRDLKVEIQGEGQLLLVDCMLHK
jgi:serine/threonine protein kinase